MKTHKDSKAVWAIDAITPYVEALLAIRFRFVKKYRYVAPCPFHADTKENFVVYINKEDEIRFHCFGGCKGDWNIYDLIMLRKKCRFRKAQQLWAEELGVADFKFDTGSIPCIPEPDEIAEPDVPVVLVKPMKSDRKSVAILEEAAIFYNDLMLLNEKRFKHIWNDLARHGVGKDLLKEFKIGYAPPYSDERYQGRALIDGFLQRFEKDNKTFKDFMDAGLTGFLNDNSVKGYGYYCRQINFKRKYPFARNYGDSLAGRIVFPVYDSNALTTGLVGRRPGDRGLRWLKHQTREVPLSDRSWLYGIEKAERHIRQYRTIILVEGIFDYFAFYNLLQDQDKPVVVSTLGSYVTPAAMTMLMSLGIEHFIVAYDWDELGRNGIERMAARSNAWVYYLGGPAKQQSPYDMLKPVVDTISGLSLRAPDDRCAMRPETREDEDGGCHKGR